MPSDVAAPLKGLKVIEFSHMVMGPSAGLVLGDLGADVIKVEPISGDKTRRLQGSGAGYFSMYNRNKRSVRIDLKSARGIEIAKRLLQDADVLIENFRPGTMQRLGLGFDAMSELNPRLIYCSTHGFLSGPYEERTALDEVAQMMGGLAYMTGPPGRPLRAGSSVIDVTGGMFGVIGVLAALEARHRTGRGQHVKSSLFETTVFLVGQHMAQYAVTGQPAAPMPNRISAWAIYDIFTTADDEMVFVGVVSDAQWTAFCDQFGLSDLGSDPTLQLNEDRVAARDRIIPAVREMFAKKSREELMQELESCGLPFAHVARPQDLFDDPHLVASGALLPVTLDGNEETALPALPLELNAEKPTLHRDLPRSGEHTAEVLRGLGYDAAAIAEFENEGVVSCGDAPPADGAKGVPNVG